MEMAIVVLVVVEVLQHLRIFVIIQNDLPRLVHSFNCIHILCGRYFISPPRSIFIPLLRFCRLKPKCVISTKRVALEHAHMEKAVRI